MAGIDTEGRAWVWGTEVCLPRCFSNLGKYCQHIALLEARDFVMYISDTPPPPLVSSLPSFGLAAHAKGKFTSVVSYLRTDKKAYLANSNATIEWTRSVEHSIQPVKLELVKMDQDGKWERVQSEDWGEVRVSYPFLSGKKKVSLPPNVGKYAFQYQFYKATLFTSEPFEVRAPSLEDFHVEIAEHRTLVTSDAIVKWKASHEVMESVADWSSLKFYQKDLRDSNGELQLLQAICFDTEPSDENIPIEEEGYQGATCKVFMHQLGKIAIAMNYAGDDYVDFENEKYQIEVIPLSEAVAPKFNLDSAQAGEAEKEANLQEGEVKISDVPEGEKELQTQLLEKLLGGASLSDITFTISPHQAFPYTPLTIKWDIPTAENAHYMDRLVWYNKANQQQTESGFLFLSETQGCYKIMGLGEPGLYEGRYLAMSDAGLFVHLFSTHEVSINGPMDIEGLTRHQEEIGETMKRRGEMIQPLALAYGKKQEERLRQGIQSATASSVQHMQEASSSSSSYTPAVVEPSQGPTDEDMADWDLETWLTGFGFERFKDAFIENGYDDLEVILALEDDDLVEIGIKQKGLRKKVMLQVAKLSKKY
eukprot:CAMPEP_0201520358 /NCGR_PEP_ID=MMETSP0161_2-20130828/10663_1 /ASSEMBLY_ACC=CAM_ASM_000251 /TAXON_ID=180227 /ORGANISM="Neoparamoeba aestuarina, Strain SoJaBio B1-5/56/2" /LENGTH=591 /DNA_ID=CAMNT_0047918681 /DNA_START=281 /DNA_END=2056 /DNA_ORIENTATION=+